MNDSLQALLTRLVDYAGLFPPANLGMPEAVENYARYRRGDHRWMLARFIVTVSRLDEFEAAAAAHLTNAEEWAVSVLPGVDLTGDLARIEAFNRRNDRRARIDTIETKADHVEAIRVLCAKVPDEIALFVEIPADDDPAPLIGEIAAAGRFAKIRTGGVTQDAFLSPETIIRFIRRCHESEVAFKATAGLHHPLRCVRPLTYEPDAPRGAMNGFVNLFLAAALVREGHPDHELVELLLTDDASAFSIDGDAIGWRRSTVDVASLAKTRRELAASFGSCSFEEPVNDLRELGWLA
jgi:hypothetical protein